MNQPVGTVDLSTCDREPIHIPGLIQPHGCLLVCDPLSWEITHASENLANFASHDASAAIGQILKDVVGTEAFHELTNALAVSGAPNLPGRVFKLPSVGSHTNSASIHVYAGHALVELEHVTTTYTDATPLFLIKSMLTRMQRAATVAEVCDIAVQQLTDLIGFDRVMIYKFLQDGSGSVVAESHSSNVPSFLGHHFPASDIPQQARTLYLKNWIRLIVDVHAQAARILPLEHHHERPIDLSYCALRSVSPVHIEYLRNMNVGASLSISIVVGGALWGLVACHNSTSKVVPPDIRVAAEFFGQAFSLQLQSLERVDVAHMLRSAREGLDKIMAEIPPAAQLSECLAPRLAEFASFIPCDGVGLWSDGGWSEWGSCPPVVEIPDLLQALNRTSNGSVFSTNEISTIHQPALAYAPAASGLLVVPLSRTPGDYLIFFRKEFIHTIDWAGDPNKPVIAGDNGNRLTPRKSFELWQNEVRGKSRAWEPHDRFTAEAMRISLLEVVLRYNEILAQERTKAERQQRLFVAELNHRVKNALALIGALVEHSKDKHENISEFIDDLEGRIRSLAQAHDLASQPGPFDLKRLVEIELRPFADTSRGPIEINGPRVLLDDHAYAVLALVLHEMTTNAAKYGALSQAGSLKVTWQVEPNGDCRIDWLERGGPVVNTPNTSGFGHLLVRRQIPFELEGKTEIFFDREGLRAYFVIPARWVNSSSSDIRYRAAPTVVPVEPISATLAGLSILVVEDSLIVALKVERMLRRVGAARVHLSATNEQAIAHIEAEEIDAAVLDINLKGEMSYPVADALAERGIPFIFETGYGQSPGLPERFAARRVVTKPFSEEDLGKAMLGALHERGKM
jgi:light-regulated signal transduction histidine kinase (bacteriophytochrome)